MLLIGGCGNEVYNLPLYSNQLKQKQMKTVNQNLVMNGKFYNVKKAMLILQSNHSGSDGLWRYYKSKSGIYFRTIEKYSSGERINMEFTFDMMRKYLEDVMRGEAWGAKHLLFDIPEELTNTKEV